MRLLLIQPPITMRMPSKVIRPPLYEPLGLGYLAAVARQHGHGPAILDCIAEGWRTQEKVDHLTRVGLSEAEIEGQLRAFNPDAIGITCQFTGFDRDCRRVAAIAKRVLPNVPVIVGGPDATSRADILIQDPNIDLIVRSEGEAVLIELLARLTSEKRLPEDVPGTTLKGKTNPPGELIDDLDALPLPARDLVPMGTYLEDQRNLMPYAKRTPVAFIISSRGCPFDCIFCSTKKIWRRWRPRSPEKVVDEIDLLMNEYGAREIAFQDDSFLANPRRVERLCEEIVRRKLDVTWTVPPGLTVQTVNEDVLYAMRDAGFYRACFPIESGDPEMLQFMRKRVDLDRVRHLIEECNRLGLWTYGNFIIGFPEEDRASIEKTAAFALDSGLDMISVYVAQPYAGSDLYTIYEKLGLLDVPNAEASTVFHTFYNTRHFRAEELRALRDGIYRRFTRRRLRRLFSVAGVKEMGRKMSTPENFLYAMRVLGIVFRNSLAARKFSLFGAVVDN